MRSDHTCGQSPRADSSRLKRSSQGFISLISIIAIVVIGAGVGGYLLYQKWQGALSAEQALSRVGQFQQNNQQRLCPDGVCDDYEQSSGVCPQDCGGVGGSQKTSQQKQTKFQSRRTDDMSVKATGATYKTVAVKPTAGWFKTGQNADIMLAGVNFNNAGGPFLFNHPGAVTSDGRRLLLADRNNNRVLIWNTLPARNAPPDLVLGQPDFTSNNPGSGTNQLNWPVSVAAAKGKVVVADTYNDRILIWNSFPATSGQPADVEIKTGSVGTKLSDHTDISKAKRSIGWPWAVWTNGQKLIVTSTATASVLIWNSFPTKHNQAADLVLYAAGDFGTPRAIASDGERLLIGDHNAKPNNGGAGNFFWKSFPTKDDQKYDFFVSEISRMSEPLRQQKGPGDILWSTLTPEGKLIGVANGLFIWKAFPENERDAADAHIPATGGDGSGAVYAGGRLYVSSSNGNKITAYNSLPVRPNQPADFAIGAADAETNTLLTNYFITNPAPATDGRSLFVASGFDHTLSVWKKLPDESGAKPDFRYSIVAPGGIALHKNTLILAEKSGRLFIWNKLPLSGELPDKQIEGRIGNVELNGISGVALDDTYFYLAVSEGNAGKIYVWEGIPDTNADPKFTLSVNLPAALSSDGKYLVVTSTLDNQGGHIKIFPIADLGKNPQPIIIIKSAQTNLPGHALATHGRLFVGDTVNNRVLIWNHIADAISQKPPSVVLGQEGGKPGIGKDKLFWPAALAFDGSFLWVGEFKFSGRILRFSARY